MHPQASAPRPTILVVDDDEQHGKLLAGILKGDYDLYTVSTLHAANALIRTTAFDLALVDLRLPDGSGAQILATLQDTQPQCLRFLVTAYADGRVLQDAVNIGQIYRFVQKPIDPDFLRVDIRRALEHRHAQHELQRSVRFAVIGRFASSVGHDLRNVMMGLAVLPDLLVGDAESISIGMATLQRTQSNLKDLSDELTLLARGGTPRYDLARGDLVALVTQTVEQLALTTAFRDRVVALQVQGEIPLLRLSAAHCRRMLVNLLRNAVEATPKPGGLGVRISRDAHQVFCTVWDQGKGIASHERSRIFEPMFSTKGESGMGLGLWSCHMTMLAHHGGLSFESEVGVGTEFTAAFPIL